MPVGVEKSSLNISFVNLTNKVVLPVVAQELPEMINFAEELSVLLSEIANTTVIDPEEFIYKEELSVVNMDFDEVVKDVFAEMVERHNSYKDGRMEKRCLPDLMTEFMSYWVISDFMKSCLRIPKTS